MAFLETTSKERFSLLLLEPGEIYLEDYSVFCYPGDCSESEAIRRKQKGRLKISSKSILFDPKDYSQPVLKFPLRECETIEKWQVPLMSKIDNKGNVIHLKCSQVIEMLENNYMAPYAFKREHRSYLFALQYVQIHSCLPQINQLQRAATLATADQAAMIAAIIWSRQSRVKFDTCWLEDLYEKILLETTGNKITPLVVNPGRILLTTSRLYFQPYNNAEPWPVLKVKLVDIKRVIKRRFLLRHIGLELYCPNHCPIKHLFLSFKSQKDRDDLYYKLVGQPDVKCEDTGKENMTLSWQNGIISNYDYLTYLNSLADRSFNDLTQYPVFPWVLSDYTSKSIDLANSSIYRDLSKPIGALNEKRLKMLKDRYDEMADPKFLYGSHYSTPGFVLYYLVRKMPQYMLCLQNGRFDHPDRMFNSVPDTWRNVTTGNSDFKELIPEFYDVEDKGSFLLHTKNLDFGSRSNGQKIGNVELPSWAESPEHFVSTLREALESDYVSQNLHNWIDLIFGYKQRGQEAIDANNIFYYLTYEGSVDLDSIKDLNEKHALEVQIMEFGQIPKQLFLKPHPQRRLPSPYDDENFLDNKEVELRNEKHAGDGLDLTNCKRKDSLNLWSSRDMCLLTAITQFKLHKDAVTDVCITSNIKYVFSVSQDSQLKMYSLEEKRQLRSINVYNMALPSCVLLEDNKTVIVGSWDNYLYTYNAEYGKVLMATLAHDDAVTDVCFQDGLLATCSVDSTAKIWSYSINSHRSSSVAQLKAELDHDAGVKCISLSSDNSMLVSGTEDGQVTLWELTSYSIVGQYSYHSGAVYCVAFSPDGKKIVSCGADSTLKVLDVQTGSILYCKDCNEELRCLCWNGFCAVTGTSMGNLIIWDLIQGQILKSIPAHSGAVTCLTVSSDGGTIVTGGEDCSVIVWQTADT